MLDCAGLRERDDAFGANGQNNPDALRDRDREDRRQILGLCAGPARLRRDRRDGARGLAGHARGPSLPHRRAEGRWFAGAAADQHGAVCGGVSVGDMVPFRIPAAS